MIKVKRWLGLDAKGQLGYVIRAHPLLEAMLAVLNGFRERTVGNNGSYHKIAGDRIHPMTIRTHTRGIKKEIPTNYAPSFSLAILTPLILFAIFLNATSLAKSAPPCFGFLSIEKGEKPQSSVAPS